MGLDFSHCDAHWAYSGFARFRNKLAIEVGLDNYYEINSTDDTRFSKIKDDPILPLLAHSDCDGYLTVSECKTVGPRLRELIRSWSDDDPDKMKAIELADGMANAAKKRQQLEFK